VSESYILEWQKRKQIAMIPLGDKFSCAVCPFMQTSNQTSVAKESLGQLVFVTKKKDTRTPEIYNEAMS
jgi:hypothetical protein